MSQPRGRSVKHLMYKKPGIQNPNTILQGGETRNIKTSNVAKERFFTTVLPILNFCLPLILSSVILFIRSFTDGSIRPPKDDQPSLWWTKFACSVAMLGISILDYFLLPILLKLTSSNTTSQTQNDAALLKTKLHGLLTVANGTLAVVMGLITIIMDFASGSFPDAKTSFEAVSSLAVAYTCFKYYSSIKEHVSRAKRQMTAT